jgi:hypothetical protein
MTSTSTDRRQGVNAGAAIKVPCRVATTANITLSGEQTIDGVAVVTDDRVLVKEQTTGSENGVYVADSGAWSLDKDWDGAFDVREGTLVQVNNGTSNGEKFFRVTTTGTIIPGTTSIAFEVALFSSLTGVVFTQAGTGAVSRPAQDKMRETVSVLDFGCVVDGVTDDGVNAQKALDHVGSVGGGRVTIPVGTMLVGSSLSIPDYTTLEGAGRGATTVKLKNSSNVDIIKRHASYSGIRCAVRHLKIDGNEDNNTAGSFFWNGSTSVGDPSMTMEHVLVTGCRPSAGGAAGAVVLLGGDWSVLRDVNIFQNNYSHGLVVQSSDGTFDAVKISQNGGLGSGKRNLVLLLSNSGTYSGCYFGGTTGDNQVNIEGAQRNNFDNCINDNAWFNGYHLQDSGGTSASYNTWTGGQCTNSGINSNNSNDNFSFNGAATGNIVNGVQVANTNANKARYGFSEGGTASGNLVIGCNVANGNFGTGVKVFNASGNSRIVQCPGYNPQGAAAIVVGASPFTYTNEDHVPEAVYITGGTVSSIAKDAITLFSATEKTIWLEPGESLIVTYTGLPTMNKDRK